MTLFVRVCAVLYRLLLWASATVLASMMLLTVADVVLRYLFNKPIYGSVEITQYLLATVVFAGLGLVTRHRGHIEVTLFEGVLKRYVPRFYRFVSAASNLAGIVFITYLMVKDAFFLAQVDQRTLMLNLPEDWIWGGLSLLGLAGVVLGLAAGTDRNNDSETGHDAGV